MNASKVIACCSISFLFQMTSAQANDKKICGVDAISRDFATESFSVDFDGKADRQATIKRRDGTFDLERKSKVLKNESKFLRKVIADAGDTVYLANGKTEGCVIRSGEQDGKKGFYIERHETMRNMPPRIESVFVEAN